MSCDHLGKHTEMLHDDFITLIELLECDDTIVIHLDAGVVSAFERTFKRQLSQAQ